MSKSSYRILRLISFACGIWAFSPGFGWAQQLHWARQFGVQGNGYAQGVSAGEGIYVTGGIRLGEALPGQTAGGQQDAMLRRYDADGSIRWTRQFGSAGNDEARGVFYYEGYIYVAGFVEGALPGQTHAGDADAFLRKYDGYGNVLWTRQFGTAARDEAFSAAVTSSRVYVNGGTRGAFPGYANPTGSIDTFVRAYDLNGNLLWARQFARPGASDDQPAGLAADNSGVYLGSWQMGQAASDLLRFDPLGNLRTQTAFPYEFKGITQDSSGYVILGRTTSGGVVTKFNKTTNDVVWSVPFGVPAFEPRAVTADSGGITLVSNTETYPQNQTGPGPAQVQVRRYTPTGSLVWTFEFGGSGWEVPTGVSYAYGFLYISGLTTGWMPGTYQRDAFVAKMSPDWERTKQVASTGNDTVTGVATARGYWYAVGSTGGSQAYFLRQFTPDLIDSWVRQAASTDVLTKVTATANALFVIGKRTLPAGQVVGLVQRYEFDGRLTWETLLQPLPGAGASDITDTRALAVTDNYLWVVGQTSGVFAQFGQSPGFGYPDAYVAGLTPWNGLLQWVRQVGTSRNDWASGVATAGSGAAVVGSYFYEAWLQMIDAYGNKGPSYLRNSSAALPGDYVGIASTPYGLYGVAVGNSGADPALRRFTNDGTFISERPLNLTGLTSPRATQVAADSSFLYVAGQLNQGVFVRCFDFNGTQQWTRVLVSTNFQNLAPDDKVNSMTTLGNGAVLLGGSTNGVMPFSKAPPGGVLAGYLIKIVGPAGVVPKI